MLRLEGLGKLKNSLTHRYSNTRPSVFVTLVPQLTTLPHGPLDGVQREKIFPLQGLEIRPLDHPETPCNNSLILDCTAEHLS
jgi:hypothetical protein